jgi:hypothetical protein
VRSLALVSLQTEHGAPTPFLGVMYAQFILERLSSVWTHLDPHTAFTGSAHRAN